MNSESSASATRDKLAEDARDLESGGRYKVVRFLGSGAMGSVRLAEDTRLHRRVAIKTVREEVAKNPEFRKRIERECLLHAKVGPHPHIVTLFDKWEQDDRIHLVMEYIEGETLQSILERKAQEGTLLPPATALAIGAQLLDALARIHALGIIHRDIKPSNVMITYDENGGVCAKLMDFGISRMMDSEDQLSRLTTTESGGPGTPMYMAPEQIDSRAYGPVTVATDIYAVGILMYQLFSGVPPFRGSLTEVLNGHLNVPLPPFELRTSQITSQALHQVLKKALAKYPNDRYPTTRAFREALLSLMGFGPQDAMVDQTGFGAAGRTAPLGAHPGAATASIESQSTVLASSTVQRLMRQKRNVASLVVGLTIVICALTAIYWTLSRMFGGETSPQQVAQAVGVPNSRQSAQTLQQVEPSPALPESGTDLPQVEQTLPAPPAPLPDSAIAPDASVPLPADAAAPITPSTVETQFPDPNAAAPAEAVALPSIERGDSPPAPFSPEGTVTVVTADGQVQHLTADPAGGLAPGTASSLEHVVQPGDTLSKIATFYGVTTRDLQWWNGIKNPNSLSVGQTIYLYERAGLPPKDEFFRSLPTQTGQTEKKTAESDSAGLKALAGGTTTPTAAPTPPVETEKPKKTLGGAIKRLFQRIKD